MIKTEKVVSIKSRSKVLKVVREHYVRRDVACNSEFCDECTHTKAPQRLSKNATFYLIPSVDSIIKYLEIFVHRDVKNVIYLQSVVMNVLHSSGNGRRTYNRIRKILDENLNNHVFFPNEHHQDTYVEREHDDPLIYHHMNLIFKAALWYYEHLNSQVSIIILSENENFKKDFGILAPQIFILSVEEFIESFMSHTVDIMNIYNSIKVSVASSGTGGQNKIYKEYLNSVFIEHGLESGRYHQGVIKVNKYHSFVEASVSVTLSNKPTEIFIFGREDRNRAIHNDEVFIEILPKCEWKGRMMSLTTNDVNADDPENNSNVVPTGRVVGISQRNWRDYVASFRLDDEFTNRKSGDRILIIPQDIRIPKIRIITRQGEQLQNERIVVRIDSWPSNSQYPNGHFVYSLGKIGDIETETSTILTEHSISIIPFSKGMLSELPNPSEENHWTISDIEIADRKDIRKSHFTFSIDPIGCEDVDDTISVKILSDDKFEIGVHIADVTHFVKPGSLCDIEARNRSTTVYLADRRFDMLPPVLSANICSLLSCVDRYAVSVIWTMNSDYDIIDVWYGKTVIHSKYKLFYEAAQNIIDETNLTDLEKDIPEFENLSMNDKKSEFKQLKSSLKLLLDISRHFRYQRLMKGGLELDSVEVQFELTSEKQVENLMLKESLEIHETVAEFMIMANHWVAKKIYEHFPHNALLRCHPKPNDEKLKLLVECAKIKDFVINTESNETLAKSLNNCVDLNDSYVNIFLRKLTTLSMHKALYFSTGSLSAENFIHFGLALDKYTHFTSPIRRYADVIVHRLLIASVENELRNQSTSGLYSNSNLQELSIHINEKTISAQYAQRASQQLYQCQYFKDKENSSVDAVITSIRSNGLVIDIPIYGLNGAVYLLDRDKKVLYFCNELENCKSEWTDGSIEQLQHSLIVHTTMGSQKYTIFDHVTVLISPHVSSSGHVNKLKFELLDRRPHHVNESTKAGSQKHNINIVKSSVDIRKDKLKSLDLSFCEPKSDETLYDILCSMKNMALGASN